MTLTQQCLGLPYGERLSLCASLQKSIAADHPRNFNRGKILLGIIEEILGMKVPSDSRQTMYVWARTMVAYQLIKEGYSTTETGRMLSKDHSTIIHLKHKMEDALAYEYAYQDIVDIWKQFQNKLQDDIQ